jgi:hypothetical protein
VIWRTLPADTRGNSGGWATRHRARDRARTRPLAGPGVCQVRWRALGWAAGPWTPGLRSLGEVGSRPLRLPFNSALQHFSTSFAPVLIARRERNDRRGNPAGTTAPSSATRSRRAGRTATDDDSDDVSRRSSRPSCLRALVVGGRPLRPLRLCGEWIRWRVRCRSSVVGFWFGVA